MKFFDLGTAILVSILVSGAASLIESKGKAIYVTTGQIPTDAPKDAEIPPPPHPLIKNVGENLGIPSRMLKYAERAGKAAVEGWNKSSQLRKDR